MMRRTVTGAIALVLMLAGCAPLDPLRVQELDKGPGIDVRQLIAAHPGQTGCVDYRAADQSCASLIKARVTGDRLVAIETGAVRGFDGQIERVSLRTRSRIVEGGSCLRPEGVEAVTDRGGMGEFLQETTRLLISQYGGEVCARYFLNGDGYVISTRGSDGRPFPPGDTDFRFVDGPVKVRAQ